MLQSEERWRSILNAVFDFLVILEPDGTIRDFLRRWSASIADDVLGESVYYFLQDAFRQDLRNLIKHVLTDQMSVEC